MLHTNLHPVNNADRGPMKFTAVAGPSKGTGGSLQCSRQRRRGAQLDAFTGAAVVVRRGDEAGM